jgi:hypothetical protein
MRGGPPGSEGWSFDDIGVDVRKCDDIISDDMPDDFALAAIL